MTNRQHVLKKRLGQQATGDRQYGTYRPWARMGAGTAPETGRPPASTAAINRQSNTGPQRALLHPSHYSNREMPSKLWPRDSDIKHRRPSVRHLPSPGPEWARSPAPRQGDGARNGAVAYTTDCQDDANSRAAGVNATIQHPDPGPRTTRTSLQSSPARCRATGDKA